MADLSALTWDDLRPGAGIIPSEIKKGKSVEAHEIAAWLGANRSDDHMVKVAAAVTAYVEALPSIARDSAGLWAEQTKLGAVMLGARLYKRRNSPNGIESFAEVGNTYISRYDSDIARMLHIEAFRKPRVG